MKLLPEEQQRLMDRFTFQPNPKLHSSSESEVSTNLIQDQLESWDCWDFVNFITVPSLESTKQQSICLEKLSHWSHTGNFVNNSRYPTRDTIRKLVYKRGYGKVNHQRVPLTNNRVVDATLGKHGISSVDDLINEIATVGPHFK